MRSKSGSKTTLFLMLLAISNFPTLAASDPCLKVFASVAGQCRPGGETTAVRVNNSRHD